jgi:hypothetical protein
MRRMCAYKCTSIGMCPPACSKAGAVAQEQEKLILAPIHPSRGDILRARSVHQQALAQPLTLSPHVTFNCDPIGKPALARRPLQSVLVL